MASMEVSKTISSPAQEETNKLASTNMGEETTSQSSTTCSSTAAAATTKNVDTVLFGSRNTIVSDEFCDKIDAALVEGVASLPLMESNNNIGDNDAKEEGEEKEESRSAKMLKLLRKAYFRNVDLAEIYAGRNIFSVSYRTPYFRQRVVAAFLSKEDDPNNIIASGSSTTDTATTETTATEKMPETKHSFPVSKEEVPTPEMLSEIEETLSTLRSKLKEARNHKLQRLRYCKDMEQAEQVTQETTAPLDSSSNILNAVSDSVETMMKGAEELKQLQSQGEALLEQMDKEKRERMNDENEHDNKLPQIAAQKKAKMTMEEDYEERRNILAPTQAGHDLAKVKGLLQRKQS